MKVAAVQLDLAFGDVERNYRHMEEQVGKAASLGADCIVLPELWNTSFYPGNVRDLADREGRRTQQVLADLARQHHVQIVGGSVAVQRKQAVYNTTYIFDAQGNMAGTYDKVHLFAPGQEDKAFASGSRLNVFSLQGVTMASVICYDLRFPEWIRMAALAGAQMLFVPAAWPDARMDHWQILNRARAIENQLFVVAVNSCGYAETMHFGGHSMIVDPWGSILAEGGTEEAIVLADADISAVAGIRDTIHVFRDRRPSLYDVSR